MNKLYERINQELPEIAFKYWLKSECRIGASHPFLSGIVGMSGISFVNGKGKRKTELHRDWEKLTEYRERIEKYKESLGICGKRKSYSKTDTEATFMRMKEDHKCIYKTVRL